MNLIVLSTNPKDVSEIIDKHLNVCIISASQILSNAFKYHPLPVRCENSVWSLWAHDSLDNMQWLVSYGLAACAEYVRRFGKVHNRSWVFDWAALEIATYEPQEFEYRGLTEMPITVPKKYQVQRNIVLSNQEFYRSAKRKIANWTNRPVPDWFKQ